MRTPILSTLLSILTWCFLSTGCTRNHEEPTDPRTEATPRETLAAGDPAPDPRTPVPGDATVSARDPDSFSSAQPGGDRDGDGTVDSDDQCPDDPEDRDAFQDSDGCPDPDNDADGIPDIHDKCPNEPEDVDGSQDDDGCPD